MFLKVSWYRNGGLLSPEKTVVQTRGNRHSLLLQQVGDYWGKILAELKNPKYIFSDKTVVNIFQQVGSVDLHGKYQCRAKNQLGEAMALTEVSGKPAPANFKSPKVGILVLLLLLLLLLLLIVRQLSDG